DNQLIKSEINYHEVIYDIYHCAPQILSRVVPYLTGKLLADQLDTHLRAVRLVGSLFTLPEFLKRLTDRVVDVRMFVLEHVKICLLSDPSRPEAPQIISALCDRLLDYDENVRKSHSISALCKAGKIDEAKNKFREMMGKNLQPDAVIFDTFIHIFCKEGMPKVATRSVANNSTQDVSICGHKEAFYNLIFLPHAQINEP
ncbi:hypothetical protein ES319_D02G129100v1, partial [Gossypium barbadense]